MNTVVFDVETKRSFQEAGTTRPGDLGISFVGAYETKTNKYHGFFEDQFDDLWSLLKSADRLVGFASNRFDLPALGAISPIKLETISSLDIYDEVYKVIHQERISLNRLAIPTLKIKKSGHGLDAIKYYREGELEKLKKYCLQDVKVTWELFKFGAEKKYLLLWEKSGMITQIPVSWELDS